MKTVFLCFALLANCAAVAQPPASGEADFLRTMYGSFPYLVGLRPPVEAAIKIHSGDLVDEQALAKKIADSKLEITVGNIKVGPTEEILDRSLASLYSIPAPPQEVLKVQVDTDEFQDVDQSKVSWQTASAKWIPADPLPPQDVLDFMSRRSIRLILAAEQERLNDGLAYSRYAAYEVMIKYQGRTQQYRAITFFAVDKAGERRALPEDGFLLAFGVGGNMNYFPTALLHSSLAHEYQPLKQFLQDHAINADQCATGRFCCVGSSCGIASADLEHELAQPVGGRKP
jgi:hypothetical protein